MILKKNLIGRKIHKVSYSLAPQVGISLSLGTFLSFFFAKKEKEKFKEKI